MHNRHYEKFADGRVKDIEDEIPFAVPEGWAWCRLPEVCRKPITDGTHNSPPSSASGDFLYITAKNIKNLAICLDDATYVSKETHESIYSRCSPELNDVLLTKDGTIGEVAVNNLNYPFSMLSSVALIKPSNGILPWFLAYILISDLLQNKMKKNAKGSALKRIILAQINNFIIPLPPLAEQKRIVTAIEAIFTQIDLMEQNKADLQTAVKQAKNKILDLAIRGKLVPQDPADEPASVMLEKLRAEKEAKIASGEVKRGKNDSYIYRNPTDNCYYEKFIDGTEEQIEIPFDLPENWCWQKISSICEINPKNKLDNTLEVSFVPMTLIDSEFNNRFSYELQRWETVKSGFSHFSDNDIGIAKITPCFENRKSVIFKNLKNKYGAGTTELHILRTNNKYIFNEYVFWFIKTDAFIKEGINNFTGAVGQQRIGKEFIAETLIPIPPLNEQVKICRTINTLIKKLDEISLNTI